MFSNSSRSLSAFSYCLALATPIFFGSDVVGAIALLYGWIGILSLELEIGIPWLANILFIVNYLFNKDGLYIKSQIVISLITISFGLIAFEIDDIPRGEGGVNFVTVGIGFVFWMSSFSILLFQQVYALIKMKRKHLISNYQEKWVHDFHEMKGILLEVNGDIPIDVEHVGSTSVPGLKAKSIIDIDMIYHSGGDIDKIKSNLESIGYYHNGNQGIEGREVFKRSPGSNHEVLDSITHHLYVCHEDSEELKRHLLFRNHLRTNANARNQYVKIKLAIAEKANQDKKTYAALKEQKATDFIQECIQKEIENGK